jgi:hypothetical protein
MRKLRPKTIKKNQFLQERKLCLHHKRSNLPTLLNEIIALRSESYFFFFPFLFLFFILSRIRPSGSIPFRVNLKLWILQTLSRTPQQGDQPVPRRLNPKTMQIFIHASSGIRTHNPDVRAEEDISWVRMYSFCDHLRIIQKTRKWATCRVFGTYSNHFALKC